MRFATSISSRSASWSFMMSLVNAVPRSNESVTFVTRQPSFSLPTRHSTGTRTSSRNTSLNSVEPSSVGSGRISMPSRFIGIASQVIPRCFSSGAVRTSSSQ
jgi:hypothetical protein